MVHTITLIEDNIAFAKLLSSIINVDENLDVVQIFSTKEAALSPDNLPTQIVIVDIQLPDGSGIDIVAQLKTVHPETIFLMCTSFDDDDKLFASLSAGASGYIVKTDDPQRIVTYIHDALHGGAPMSHGIAMRLVKHFQQQTNPQPLDELSAKENLILQHLSKGFLYKEIATQENISIDTVKKHCGNIYRKLHVSNKTEAINKLNGQ
jgi:two-component system, NarL family, response regulator LiaR